MQNIIKRVYCGSDADVEKAKSRDYSRLACCKDGPDGHRAMLGYTTMGAPKGDDYLFASRPRWGAMNCIDVKDVDMIPDEMIFDALKWVKKEYDSGRTILFHCNAGHSRGPTMALVFLRAIGEMPNSFPESMKIFRTLYSSYDPETGMRRKARTLWRELPEFFPKG